MYLREFIVSISKDGASLPGSHLWIQSVYSVSQFTIPHQREGCCLDSMGKSGLQPPGLQLGEQAVLRCWAGWLTSPANVKCSVYCWTGMCPFPSSWSMKCQCHQWSEIGPDWKSEAKACNFNSPDIAAIIILSHLLKTKWYLSCRKGQNATVSVPLEELINFLEQRATVVRNMILISSITSPGVRTLGWSVSLLLHQPGLDPACGDYPFPLERKIVHLHHASVPWHDGAETHAGISFFPLEFSLLLLV